jgi:hypothetical protein
VKLAAFIRGDLQKMMKQEAAAAEKAVTKGVVEATLGLKADLRNQVVRSGLGERMAKTWKHRRYPPTGYSVGTAGLVYADMPQVIRAFSEGTTIRSPQGFFLAVPTPAAPKRGVGGKRINPSNFPEHSYGRLRFVYRKGRPSLLVVDNLRASTGKRGGFRKASDTALRTGRGVTTVVMFILLPQVSLRKRLDTQSPATSWERRLPELIIKHWENNDDG